MPTWKPLPSEINGFKIIQDLGYIKSETAKRKYRLCIAECKKCKRHWKVRPFDLNKIESCHCTRIDGNQNLNYRLRSIFKDMYKRCYNNKTKRYEDYGGRGILICDEWLNDRRKFYEWSISNGYQDSLTIDRIDNSKGYSPENCRWVDRNIQMQNSSKAKLNKDIILQIRSEYPELSYSKLAKKYNVHKSTIAYIVKNKTWRNY